MHQLAIDLPHDCLQALSTGKIGDSTIFVPDADGHLIEARDLCYDDAPWMAHKDARLIHPDISNQVGPPTTKWKADCCLPNLLHLDLSLSVQIDREAKLRVYAGCCKDGCKIHEVFDAEFHSCSF